MATTLVDTARKDGKIHRSFSQSAAEASALVADPVNGRIVVYRILLVMDGDGTADLLSGTATLTGVLTLKGGSGLVINGTQDEPLFECANSEALNLTTVTAGAKGFILYAVKPQ